MKFIIGALLLCSFFSFADSHREIENQIEAIFRAANSQDLDGMNRYMEFVAEDVILMPHRANTVAGKEGYKAHVQAAWQTGETKIQHQLIDFDVFDEVVIARGKAIGTFQPKDSPDIYNFQTKNIFIFKRIESHKLQVWKVIFNMDP